jgi:hypothetical protein
MKVAAVATLLFAAVVVASPNRPAPPAKPVKPTKPTNQNNNQQTITCGNDMAAFCCNQDNQSIGAFVCSAASNNCNSIVVCCNVNNQVCPSSTVSSGLPTAAGPDGAPVIQTADASPPASSPGDSSSAPT